MERFGSKFYTVPTQKTSCVDEKQPLSVSFARLRKICNAIQRITFTFSEK